MPRYAVIISLAIVAALVCVFWGKCFVLSLKNVREKLSNFQFAFEKEKHSGASNAGIQSPPPGIQVQPQLRTTGKEIADLRVRLAQLIRTFDDVVPVLGPPDIKRPATKFASEQLTYTNLSAEYAVTFERIVENNRDGLKVFLVSKESGTGSKL